MRSIKFIANDGKSIECDEKMLRALKSEMIDRMLDSGMLVTQECELDFSIDVISAVLQRPRLGVTCQLLGEMIELTDYLQMNDDCEEFCTLLVTQDKLYLWTPRVAEIAATYKRYLPLLGASTNELVEMVYRGFSRKVFEDYAGVEILPEAVCRDPRCTPELFNEWFNHRFEPRNLYGYVKRGFLDPVCALKLLQRRNRTIVLVKQQGTPLKFDLLIRLLYTAEINDHPDCSYFATWDRDKGSHDKVDRDQIDNNFYGLQVYAVY